MPAHRSEAEGAIRDDVVAKLRAFRPSARILHEVNLLNGRVRCDVMAVDVSEIITVEIKSSRDKLDRLATQLDAMHRTSHTAIAAMDRKFLPDDALNHRLTIPRTKGMKYDQIVWWHPTAQDMAEAHHPAFNWEEPPIQNFLQQPLPHEALTLLHANELVSLCARLGLATPSKATMMQTQTVLRWGATGRDLCHGICRALRSRTWAAEADPPCNVEDE